MNYFGDDTTEVVDAMVDLVNLGRGGLGTSIVFSAGNSRGTDDNVNYHGYQNSPYVITVAGTDINGELYSASTK
ncbi:MAG: S8 family serine peptidase, partial [Bdellovibrionales bacterium]